MNNDDRELLALAAKAAGYEMETKMVSNFLIKRGTRGRTWCWNPLTNDEDAFALMVDCKLTVSQWFGGVEAIPDSGVEKVDEYVSNEIDRAAATRRAIVRAAAELGRQK